MLGRVARLVVGLFLSVLLISSEAESSSFADALRARAVALKPAPGDQDAPAVVFDGRNYFVVWADYRSGPVADIYGSRVSQAGAVLDPGGIRIARASVGARPAVAFNGRNYLVVWEDARAGPNVDLYGARVSRGGRVLDRNGLAIAEAPWYQDNPVAASDGSSYFVAWQDSRSQLGGNQVFGTRISADGSVADPGGVPISAEARVGGFPNLSIAFGGANYLAVWGDARSHVDEDVYGARISLGGRVLDADGIPIAATYASEGGPSVASDRSSYLVAWNQYVYPQYAGIGAARVSASGQVRDAFVVSAPEADEQVPSVTFDGRDYLLVWERYFRIGEKSDIYGIRVGRSGAVLDPRAFPISTALGDQTLPRIASGSTNSLAVWQDARLGDAYHIYGARINRHGKVLDPNGILISRAYEPCRVPKVVGLVLPRARRSVLRAHCRVGAVTPRASSARKNGRVLAQSPRPGRRFPTGHRVSLVVGTGPRKS